MLYPMVLSRLAWLNIEADIEAKASIDSQHHRHLDYKLPNKPWHLKIAGRWKAKQPKLALRSTLNGPPAQQYWCTKMPHLSLTLNEVDSVAIKQAIHKVLAHKW